MDREFGLQHYDFYGALRLFFAHRPEFYLLAGQNWVMFFPSVSLFSLSSIQFRFTSKTQRKFHIQVICVWFELIEWWDSGYFLRILVLVNFILIYVVNIIFWSSLKLGSYRQYSVIFALVVFDLPSSGLLV